MKISYFWPPITMRIIKGIKQIKLNIDKVSKLSTFCSFQIKTDKEIYNGKKAPNECIKIHYTG